ncbi:hypothetical protein [Haloferax sp. DFSO52]|uniref:DUF7519 family protein n=1 Tax=Haloferax sp. DFSO52 TaxID=3388505 RepID=UPI003A8C4A68
MSEAVTRRPVRLSALVSLLAASVAVSLIEPAATVGMFVMVVGIAVTREGAHRFRETNRLFGTAALGIGGIVSIAGVGLAATSVTRVPGMVEVGLGIVGLGCLGLGTLPLRGTGSRLLVKLGNAAILLCIVGGGLFQDAGTIPLLLSCAALVLSWDAAENSINVGEQLGRESKTWPVESAHLGVTAVVGGIAVVSGLVVRDLGTPGLPLHSVVFLLVALVFLTLALHD